MDSDWLGAPDDGGGGHRKAGRRPSRWAVRRWCSFELGLYSDDVQRLGMLGSAVFGAARLVVGTGLHARGWSRARAREVDGFRRDRYHRVVIRPARCLGQLRKLLDSSGFWRPLVVS